jgi:hypothetical protein
MPCGIIVLEPNTEEVNFVNRKMKSYIGDKIEQLREELDNEIFSDKEVIF